MLVVTNTIKVKEGAGTALAQRFAGAGGVQDMPGFVRMEVWHGSAKEGVEELKICTVWENEEAFKGWTSSEAFRQSHRGAGGNESILGASLDKYDLLFSRTPGQ
ncbi:heme oxygenase (staphylobilin-producing) [Paenibacillus sophorae]|uniref:Antibiotic biosynthesis monooxygenase n=1 Tax=Paenibacillus sophorae TaxID=1333845 RepID=A0A1H8IFP3_9BACL|nr:antibiotic biosynthesis monooxygenase [Paenibacillus sophorae]QWU15958.1 antibiotic biosynthesis monooxygenase [Paenibacillus sophorae]SEN67630.1 heme oxygenase (staphylobilin-producing) [Paenibacillus sophorae]